MYLNKIEAFANVVKYKSFSKAAKVMHLSQPSVSSYVKALESELDVQLLNRNANEITPTEAGRVLYDYAVEILELRDISRRAIQNFSQDASGSVFISACPMFPQTLIAEVMNSFSKDYPHIVCHITQADDSHIMHNLESFKIDFGLSDTPSQSDKLVCEPFFSDPIVLVTPNTDDYPASGSHFPISKLLNIPLIISSECASIHAAIMKFVSEFGIGESDLNIPMRLPSDASILHAVQIGSGAAFVSRHAAIQHAHLKHVRMFNLNSPALQRDLYLISRNGTPQSNAAALLAHHIRSRYQATISDGVPLL